MKFQNKLCPWTIVQILIHTWKFTIGSSASCYTHWFKCQQSMPSYLCTLNVWHEEGHCGVIANIIISVVLSCCGGRRRRWSSFRGRSAVTALGDKTSFGPPFVFCVLELSRKSPCLWACFHSLSPLSVVSAKKGNLYYNSAQSLLNGPPLSNYILIHSGCPWPKATVKPPVW